MKMTDIWTLYVAEKRILGFSPHTLKAYFLVHGKDSKQ